MRDFKENILKTILEDWEGSRKTGTPSPPFKKDGSSNGKGNKSIYEVHNNLIDQARKKGFKLVFKDTKPRGKRQILDERKARKQNIGKLEKELSNKKIKNPKLITISLWRW